MNFILHEQCAWIVKTGILKPSQSPLRKKANKQTVTSQNQKLKLSKKSKDAFSSWKEEESLLKKNVKKQS